MAKYREQRRVKKYLLNNGSTLVVTTVTYIDVFLGIPAGPAHVATTKLDGRTVPAAKARALARASGYDIG